MANVVSAVGANIPSQDLNGPVDFMKKYDEERTKRIRNDGLRQYIRLEKSDRFKHFLEDPWVEAGTPINRPVPDGGRVKILILGAGFAGILFAVKLLQAGFKLDDLLIVDSAGGFGGTWYWNRYPGLMCDIESYIYMPLLEENDYMPKRKYSSGEELRLYAELICTKYDLHRRTMFQSDGKTMSWDANKSEWVAEFTLKPKGGSESQTTIHADFVMMAPGLLNKAHAPDFGLDLFKGRMWHTSRWDYDFTGGSPESPDMTKLQDKRVAIIGTGATSVQCVPELAKWSKELYVFQRTPSSIDRRDNRETDPNEWKSISAKRGWQRERQENFMAFINTEKVPDVNLVDDGWTHCPSFSAFAGSEKKVTLENMMDHVKKLHEVDYPRSERVRKRAEETVKDPATASKLQAWYPSWCKRPCFHDEYLPTFNRDNVHLVDSGVDRLTPTGLEANGKSYEVDVVILATGFVSPLLHSAAGKAGMSIFGRNGKSLDEHYPETLHGVVNRGFPNLFFPGPLQSGNSGSNTSTQDYLTTHVAYIVAEATRRVGGKRPLIEPSEEGQQKWAATIAEGAAAFAAMGGCTPGYYNLEAEMDKIPPEARMAMASKGTWAWGIASFGRLLEAWRENGKMEGLEVTAVE